MKYRQIKRCENINVSEIALGCEGFLGKSKAGYIAMTDKAFDLGINFIDMYTSDPVFRSNFGAAIKGRRHNIVLQGHIGSAWENGQYLRTRNISKARLAFEDQLKRLGTDYLDIGMIHYVDGMEDFNKIFGGDFIKYCESLKQKGAIRALGMSSHNPVVALKAVETGLIDVLMFSVNAAYDMMPPGENVDDLFEPENYKKGFVNADPHRTKLYEYCEREGIAIDVMKTFGGGDMLSAELSPFGVAFNEYQCIEYCLTRPGVVSVMAGCHSTEEMEKLTGYYTASAEERDYSLVLSKMDKFKFHGNCMYCGHCAPCTMGINIADVNKYLNLSLAQGGVPETVADHYKLLEHHGGECIECGRCEKNCPFGVEIIKKMKKAQEIFGY